MTKNFCDRCGNEIKKGLIGAGEFELYLIGAGKFELCAPCEKSFQNWVNPPREQL